MTWRQHDAILNKDFQARLLAAAQPVVPTGSAVGHFFLVTLFVAIVALVPRLSLSMPHDASDLVGVTLAAAASVQGYMVDGTLWLCIAGVHWACKGWQGAIHVTRKEVIVFCQTVYSIHAGHGL